MDMIRNESMGGKLRLNRLETKSERQEREKAEMVWICAEESEWILETKDAGEGEHREDFWM